MTTPAGHQATFLRDALNNLVDLREAGHIPRVVVDDTEWETHISLKKCEWKFNYQELPRAQSYSRLQFCQHVPKVFNLKQTHLSSLHESYLSQCFQEAVEVLGQFVAGDEKLFKWTGESMWVRKCPGKDDELGLWNYGLVAELENGLGFLLYILCHKYETSLGGRMQLFKTGEE